MLVAIERWKYPFPFRTRKSSTPSPMILPKGGKVGRCQLFFVHSTAPVTRAPFFFARAESAPSSSARKTPEFRVFPTRSTYFPFFAFPFAYGPPSRDGGLFFLPPRCQIPTSRRRRPWASSFDARPGLARRGFAGIRGKNRKKNAGRC